MTNARGASVGASAPLRARPPLVGAFQPDVTTRRGTLKHGLLTWLQDRGFVIAKGVPTLPEQFSPEELAIFQRVAHYTVTPPERAAVLIDAVTYVSRRNIPGAIAECGVWRGGSMMVVALTLLGLQDMRDLYLFDTFEGMTPPTERDVDLAGVPQADMWASSGGQPVSYAPLEDVKAALASTGYCRDHVHFVKGSVEQTLPEHAPDSLALLRLDTDWYESTKHELETLYPRLAPGGVLLIDDYGHFRGAREAVDEYFANTPIFFARTDYTARVAIKPAKPS